MISIHAPLTGSDDFLFFHIYLLLFQSTLPSQGATKSTSSYTAKILISIHAPLTGSDFLVVLIPLTLGNFNPRSPHRERRPTVSVVKTIQGFQSTLPSQGATLGLSNLSMMILHFNPRSPHRERQGGYAHSKHTYQFQSTLPSQGATSLLIKKSSLK